MYRIFLTLCLFIVMLFVFALWTGHTKADKPFDNLDHFSSGLLVCICGVGVHALVIVYFIGTGRTIKAAVQEIQLPVKYLERSNFWYQTRGFLWAGLSCVFLVTTLVLGGALDSGRNSLFYFHSGFAYTTILFNLFTFVYEYRALKKNGELFKEIDDIIENNTFIPTPPKEGSLTDTIEPPAPFMLGQKLVFYGVTVLFPYVFLKKGWGWYELAFWPFLVCSLLLFIPGVILKIIYRPSTWMPPKEPRSEV